MISSKHSLNDSIVTTAHFRRGFLPETDPARAFVRYPELAWLDELGRDLPSLLTDKGFRAYAETLNLPVWPRDTVAAEDLPELHLYYVRVGFLASGYINQVGHAPATVLPANLAVPLCRVCRLLDRPPILSYDGYALYNWKRFNPGGEIRLRNIDTLQNFVHLYDEHWFILVHVEIEASAAGIVHAAIAIAVEMDNAELINASLGRIEQALRSQIEVLKRIPEKMDPALYYRTFRPYIRFFENVTYAGVEQTAIHHRGETGAQSSIMPLLEALMKIPHRPSVLTEHLLDMRRYMPPAHRALIETVERLPDLKALCDRHAFDAVLDAMATFREIHYTWADTYIHQHTDDPRGTGGTPYTQWLKQLIDETRGYAGRR